MATTALAKAMSGEKVSEKAAPGALGEAVSKLTNLKKRAESTKGQLMAAGKTGLHVAENQLAVGTGSLAEGYFGKDKLKVAGIDLRLGVGTVAAVYGVYNTANGGDVGDHAAAFGSGLLSSFIASAAVEAGQKLANSKGQPVQAPATPQPGMSGVPSPRLSGQVREVLMSPTVSGRRDRVAARRRSLLSQSGQSSQDMVPESAM